VDTLRGYVRRADLFQEHAGGVPMSDETYGRIKLRDLTIIDQFICYSEYRMEAEPTHRVLIHATGRGAGEGSSDSPALRRRSVRPVQLASRDSVGARVGCDWQR
jgi:hypothetical protein